MASRLVPEINEKAIPTNTNKATKFGLSAFQGKVLFLSIILRVNFTREAEIVTLRRKSLFTNFKIRHKNKKIAFFTSLIHWLVYVNVIIHLSVGQKPGLFTSTSVNNCSLSTFTSGNNCSLSLYGKDALRVLLGS